MGHVATTEGVKGEDVRDLMVVALEQRFGQVKRLPAPIEWLSDNGSCYTATETRKFAKDIGFLPVTTPVESPQSNGMAEAFGRTFKRDYVAVNPTPDAATVIRSLPKWFAHYNRFTPIALSDIVPRASSSPKDQPISAWSPCPEFKGLQHPRASQRVILSVTRNRNECPVSISYFGDLAGG
jgi:putative transposase